MDASPIQPVKAPIWMSAILWLAAVYDILWGTVAIVLPNQMFEWAEMTPLNYPQIWQGMGLVIAVFGIGYAMAAANPYRYWPIVAMGLLAKLGATGGMAAAFAEKTFPERFIYQAIPNDVIWIVPFALILKGAWRAAHPLPERAKSAAKETPAERRERIAEGGPDPEVASDGEQHGASYKAAESAALATATRQATLHRGHMLSALSLRELSDKTPTLVVFLRHLGCSFCRETLATIAENRKAIESKGVAIVLVHMSPPNKALKLFEKYGLDEPEPIWHISDPTRRLYQTFELPRGKVGQLLGFQELTRGFKAAILDRHLFGLVQGDGKQLAGTFLFYRRRIIKAYRTTRASDRVDVESVASCPVDQVPALPPESSTRRSTGATFT